MDLIILESNGFLLRSPLSPECRFDFVIFLDRAASVRYDSRWTKRFFNLAALRRLNLSTVFVFYRPVSLHFRGVLSDQQALRSVAFKPVVPRRVTTGVSGRPWFAPGFRPLHHHSRPVLLETLKHYRLWTTMPLLPFESSSRSSSSSSH